MARHTGCGLLAVTPEAGGTHRRAPRLGIRLARGTRVFALGCGLLLVGLLSIPDAWGQPSPLANSPPGAGNIATGRRNGGTPEKPPIPPPDAIPGAKPREPAAPAPRGANDMAPNDALFDAINRGDIASARDALNRGAELNAVNILGMTPMELSVDLGRNDISFLLLSMRGEDSGRGSRSVGRDAPATPAETKTVARRGTAKASARAASPARPFPVAQKPVATPKLFARDGGTPLPNAGFLGFDPHAASN